MSSKPAPARTGLQVRPFPYVEANAPLGETASATSPVATLEEDTASVREEALKEGRRQGEASARQGYEAQLDRLRASLRDAVGAFAQERTRYFHKVESEVVQLALSIAGKILHREAQVDPLLLAGLVRVVLEKIDRNTKVEARVNPQQVGEFRAFFERNLEAELLPEVVADAAVEPDLCVLHTDVGTTEVGVPVQLKEIEQGLMDLLAQRPQP